MGVCGIVSKPASVMCPTQIKNGKEEQKNPTGVMGSSNNYIRGDL